jgi:uncharacterized delta-60 repeat protein
MGLKPLVAGALLAAAFSSLAMAAPKSEDFRVTPYAGCPPRLAAPTPGAIDRGFADCGVRVTAAAESTPGAPIHYDATDLAILPDDRIVVVGRRMSQIGNGSDTLVLRYTANGALDETFGTGGVVVVNASASGFGFESARGVIVRADGGIVVVGTAGNETIEGTRGYILSLTSTGALDTTFGGTGIVPIWATKDATGVIPDGAGGYYVAGKACEPACTAQLTHVLASGALDRRFGTRGTLAITYAGGAETAQAIAAARSRFVVAGLSSHSGGRGDLGYSRFSIGDRARASLETAFTRFSSPVVSLGGRGAVADATLGGDLVVHVGGSREQGRPAAPHFTLVRIGVKGAPTVTTSVFPGSAESAIHALARTPSRIYAVGHVRMTGGDHRMALAAYTHSAALDTSFSGDGLADFSFAGDVRATAVGVQSSGGVVIAGRRLQTDAAPGAVVLVRVTP